jgi:hypothetical protein
MRGWRNAKFGVRFQHAPPLPCPVSERLDQRTYAAAQSSITALASVLTVGPGARRSRRNQSLNQGYSSIFLSKTDRCGMRETAGFSQFRLTFRGHTALLSRCTRLPCSTRQFHLEIRDMAPNNQAVERRTPIAAGRESCRVQNVSFELLHRTLVAYRSDETD